MSYKKSEILVDFSQEIIKAKEGKTLNKPFRTPKGPKKFSVYVKNEKGNVVKVNFGDPNMEIKRDDPERRKSFRARHNCENPGPKTKARYWSCKMWSKKSVTQVTKGEWDGETFAEYSDLIAIYPNLEKAESVDDCECGHDCGCINEAAETPTQHYFETKEEALKDAEKMNLEGFHTHKTEDGKTLYMAGPNHEVFMKRHNEIVQSEKGEAKSGLWDNIRKKKKREGKKYRAAKPGDKDRPSPEAWKKAQK